MKRRWLPYLGVGALFGVFDYFYLGWLAQFRQREVFGSDSAGQGVEFVVFFVVLNLGVWLVPVVPVAFHEARRSGSLWRPALAGASVWVTGIIAYYLANAVQLAWGVPGREELALVNYRAPSFWDNWASALQGDILSGIVGYMALAVVGGAMVGLFTGWLWRRQPTRGAATPSTPVSPSTPPAR